MKFFRVINKARGGQWVIARDREDAESISRKFGHIRGEPKKIYEAPHRDNIPQLLESGKRGIVVKRIRGYTFDEVFSGNPLPPQPKDPYEFAAEV